MQITILGAGAVGIGLATALARPAGGTRAEAPIGLVVRDPARRAGLAAKGLVRSGLFGSARVDPERLVLLSESATIAEAPPDWLLICTKAWASAAVARALEPVAPALRSAGTRLILCQNGWGNEAPFLSFWPRARLFHARVITGFQEDAPGVVRITAHAAPIALGHLDGTRDPELDALARRIEAGGLPCETRDDMESVLWAKMLYNCALNPLGALLGRRYGELANDPGTRAVMAEVVGEIFDVLAKTQYAVAWPAAESYLEFFHRELIPPTAAHESSMLQDLRAGRPTEIEALCGAVARLGAEHGVSTPTVSALATLVRAAEARVAD